MCSGISVLYPFVWQMGHLFIHLSNVGYCCKYYSLSFLNFIKLLPCKQHFICLYYVYSSFCNHSSIISPNPDCVLPRDAIGTTALCGHPPPCRAKSDDRVSIGFESVRCFPKCPQPALQDRPRQALWSP